MSDQHVLVTFLGAPDRSRPPTRRPRPHYQEITYDFRRCTPSSAPGLYTERFFPFALREHLEKTGRGIQAMVIFGTPGSGWDEFLLHVGIPGLLAPDLEDLRRQASHDEVEEAQINARWAEAVRKALRLQGVQFKVIDYARTLNDQVGIIGTLNEATESATAITLDVTHGLRYMPLLGSLASYVVETTRGSPTLPAKGSAATVKGVWYGALDLKKPDDIDQEIAPAVDVGGLSRIVDWLAAFKNFDWDGDYGAFAEPLKKGDREELEAGKLLAEAAFFERLGRFVEAQSKFKEFDETIRTVLEKAPGAHGLIGLFKDQLRERIELSNSSAEELYKHQCHLAWHHLKHEDVVHAAIWGREAAVTRITIDVYGELTKPSRLGLKPEHAIRHYKVRKEACSKFVDKKIDSRVEPLRRILDIRNALAHAVDDMQPATDDVKRDVAAALACAKECNKKLKDYFRAFGLPAPSEQKDS